MDTNKETAIKTEDHPLADSSTPKTEGNTYPGIDALRTFACIAIVFFHVYALSGVKFNDFSERLLTSFNWLVYMFMMISGFGMCCGYYEKCKSNRIDYNKFYLKRYAKILPFFAILILADVLVERSWQSLAEAFAELTLIFGYLPNNNLSVIGVSWTIGVIFLFYIAFPFFVFLLWNKKRAWFCFAVSVVLQVLCVLYFMTDRFVIEGFTLRHSFLFCIPFFIAGGVIYLYKDALQKMCSKMWIKVLLAAVCLAATALYRLIPLKINGFSLNEIYTLILYSLWIIFAIAVPNRVFINKVTKYISGISMEIYLSHLAIFRVVEKTGIFSGAGGVITYLAMVASVLVLSVIFVSVYKFAYKFVKNKLPKSRRS